MLCHQDAERQCLDVSHRLAVAVAADIRVGLDMYSRCDTIAILPYLSNANKNQPSEVQQGMSRSPRWSGTTMDVGQEDLQLDIQILLILRFWPRDWITSIPPNHAYNTRNACLLDRVI